MTVSLCIIAYNEEGALPSLLSDILAQSYDKALTELVFTDSGSTDGTAQIFEDFRSKHCGEYLGIKIVSNPDRIQAAGWNRAIMAASGDVIIRVDAHASIPPEFILENMKLISGGEYVCGGARPNNILDPDAHKEMLLLAESAMFGSSFASYRRQGTKKEYVDSIFHGAYRREVFAKVGGFDESLGRTEDNELHWRIRQNGFRICQSPDIISWQNIRPDLVSMIKQKYGNGKWIGLTTGVCPGCISVFHFAPFCLVTAFLICAAAAAIGAAAGIFWALWPLIILTCLYLSGIIMISLMAVITAEKRSPWLLLLPYVFVILHFAYGIGTAAGFILLPGWKRSLDGSAQRRIEEVKRCAAEKLCLNEDK